MQMKLTHYSSDKIYDLDKRNYHKNHFKNPSKPNGIWFSVEGGYGWKEWCIDEDFRLESLIYKHDIILKKECSVIILSNPKDIFDFSDRFQSRHLSKETFLFSEWTPPSQIDWLKVEEEYQGIIITPYQPECRFSPKSSWYYGWDCASGCIWDINAIEVFKPEE